MQITRRRFIGITAAVSAASLLPSGAVQGKTTEPVVWQGVALGADAELRLYHPNRAVAERLVNESLAEISRLEKIFSVYQSDSQVSRLNRAGSLHSPSADLLALLSQSLSIHSLTNVEFDPTVQVLWQRYAEHFRQHPRSNVAPNVQAALNKVGLQNVQMDGQKITFAKPNMAITLNGIAQGYITDRITQLLQRAGLQHALVNMGEQYPEFAKIKNPRGAGTLPNHKIPLQNQALATSSGYGTPFDANGKFTHLFDPRTGSSAPRYQSISVWANTATMAEALSTAFAVSSEAQIQTVVKQAGVKVWLITLDGQVKTLG